MACPILLMLSALAWRSEPSSAKASSSKKHHTRPPDWRNWRSLTRVCSLVVNTAGRSGGTNSSTICSAAAFRSARAEGPTNPGTARNPSRWYCATCSSLRT